VGADLFHEDGRTDRHEDKSRFSEFFANVPKNTFYDKYSTPTCFGTGVPFSRNVLYYVKGIRWLVY